MADTDVPDWLEELIDIVDDIVESLVPVCYFHGVDNPNDPEDEWLWLLEFHPQTLLKKGVVGGGMPYNMPGLGELIASLTPDQDGDHIGVSVNTTHTTIDGRYKGHRVMISLNQEPREGEGATIELLDNGGWREVPEEPLAQEALNAIRPQPKKRTRRSV